MADAYQDMGMESLSASEDEYLGDMPTQISQRRQQTVPPRQPEQQLATKVDLSGMVTDLKAFFTAELAGLKSELNALTGRIQATEDGVQDLKNQQDATAAQTLELAATCTQLNARMGQLEDAARQRNLKVRGIPDTITAEELPYLIKRLLQATFPPKQARSMTLDGLLCIPGRPGNAPESARDVILNFKSRLDKDGFLRAVRDQTPFAFEDLSLNFYQDLSRQTLQWRASLKETTAQLRTADIPYKWGYPRLLIATQDGHNHRLTSPEEAPQFCAPPSPDSGVKQS
ncbi:Hypothetical predicted protein [Pelobates cultripes]|uniref:Uncharacterized protein n=1 Tax=Pelobates cultripes TaxID=61616 RepID=A0AAD1TDV9_PELCU|nr:Hypothetical predicted protein [Pelobates cultripes]